MAPFQNTIMVNFIRCQEEDSQEVFLFTLPLVVDGNMVLSPLIVSRVTSALNFGEHFLSRSPTMPLLSPVQFSGASQIFLTERRSMNFTFRTTRIFSLVVFLLAFNLSSKMLAEINPI